MREERYYIEKLDVNDFCISISDEGNEKLSLEAFHIIDDENNVNRIAILRAIKSSNEGIVYEESSQNSETEPVFYSLVPKEMLVLPPGISLKSTIEIETSSHTRK